MLPVLNAKQKFGSWEEAVVWLREQPNKQELVKAAYYDDPLLDTANRYHSSEEWQEIRKFYPVNVSAIKTMRALDVGAGRGIASFALAKDGFVVDALEPDNSAIVGAKAIRGLAKEANLPITVSENFSETLPYDDASFDVVFARAVLHHTKDLGKACQEFYRVLKPGGVFIAVREHVLSKKEDLPVFLDAHPLHNLYGGENAFLLSEYQSAISQSGFLLSTTLSPLESSINYSPYTLRSLQAEISQQIGGRIPLGASLLKSLFAIPPIWFLTQKLLTSVDNRPGRLYSFIARKPN
jgi:SAM-dependent methyltransferase